MKNVFYAAVRREQRRSFAAARGLVVPEPFHVAVPFVPSLSRLLAEMGETPVKTTTVLSDEEEPVEAQPAVTRTRVGRVVVPPASRKRPSMCEEDLDADLAEASPSPITKARPSKLSAIVPNDASCAPTPRHSFCDADSEDFVSGSDSDSDMSPFNDCFVMPSFVESFLTFDFIQSEPAPVVMDTLHTDMFSDLLCGTSMDLLSLSADDELWFKH